MGAKASLENGSKPLLLVGAGGGRQLLRGFQWCLLLIPGSLKKRIDNKCKLIYSVFTKHMVSKDVFINNRSSI